MAKSNLPKSWEEFYAGFVQIPTEHGGRQNYRIKYILKLCAPPPTYLWSTPGVILEERGHGP